MSGGGKYEHETTEVRKKIRAAGVIMIVYQGCRGNGFEVQVPPHVIMLLPKVLREMADNIESDLN